MKTIESLVSIKDTEIILNKLLFNLLTDLNSYSEHAIYFDLHRKYRQEKKIIKDESYAYNPVNKAYLKFRKFVSKHSRRQELLQKLEAKEDIERLFSDTMDDPYNIGNFYWYVEIKDEKGYENSELLIRCLDDYDSFKAAIRAGVIKVVNSIKIHNDICRDVKPFDEYLITKMKNKTVDFYQSDIEVPNWDDDKLTEMIINYSINIEDPDYDGMDESDDDIHMYFLQEYLEEMRRIAFRLFGVYYYFVQTNNDVNDPNSYEDDDNMRRALQYYYLEDSFNDLVESEHLDDNYFTDFESLDTFYKLYLGKLVNILKKTINEYEKQKGEDNSSIRNRLSQEEVEKNTTDYDDKTKKLIYEVRTRRSKMEENKKD